MQKTEQRLTSSLVKQVEMDYLLYLPETQLTDKLPMLLFLHGAGERGSNLSLVKKHGPPLLLENGTELPFIVVAPQCPPETWWQIDELAALTNHIIEKYQVDQQRIYLTGMSMGGYGTWALANACPERFAAIAPVCAPFTFVSPNRFSNIPVWCFHGAMDEVVSVTDSIKMTKWLRQNEADVRLSIYPDAEHDVWRDTYAGTKLYDWFLSHSKS